jgi:hypothetical protein
MSYDIEARREEKMRSDNRILILKVMEGKKATDTMGRVDGRLFTGENKLHGVYDTRTGMWSMRYSVGVVPGGLQEKFMDFESLVAHAKKYFATRNVEIAGIID